MTAPIASKLKREPEGWNRSLLWKTALIRAFPFVGKAPSATEERSVVSVGGLFLMEIEADRLDRQMENEDE